MSDSRMGLWDAINDYTAACGGDTSSKTVSGRRMDAVSRIEFHARRHASPGVSAHNRKLEMDLADLRAERDELLAALELATETLAALNPCDSLCREDCNAKKARALIARVRSRIDGRAVTGEPR